MLSRCADRRGEIETREVDRRHFDLPQEGIDLRKASFAPRPPVLDPALEM
jgi:hypothetical protein